MERSDRELNCLQCGQSFTFTGGEQAFYLQNQLQDPKRCKPCRGARKSAGGADQASPSSRGSGDSRNVAARGNGNGNGNGNSVAGSQSRRSAPGGGYGQGYRMAAPDDPNGYRSPGFQDQYRDPYKIDYAGLPADDDESDGQAAMLGGTTRPGFTPNTPAVRVQTQTPRPRASAGSAGNGLPRGLNGRRPDRAGTDPDAYRSPGFVAEPAATRTGPSRRERRAQRPRFEATCAECGAAALVPFQPAADRPAFCKPCYQIQKPLLGLGPGKTPRVDTDGPSPSDGADVATTVATTPTA